MKRWPEKESCTTQGRSCSTACPQRSGRGRQYKKPTPPNQSKRAHEPKHKGKAPLISRKREGAKHKKFTSTVLRHRPPSSLLPPHCSPTSTPETLAAAAAEILVAAAITAPLDASGARGRRSAACVFPVRAPGAALRAQSLSRLPAKRGGARRLSPPPRGSSGT